MGTTQRPVLEESTQDLIEIFSKHAQGVRFGQLHIETTQYILDSMLFLVVFW